MYLGEHHKMLKYCFIKNEKTGLVQLGVGCPDEYYIEIGMKQRDVEQSETNGQWYLTELCPHYTDKQKLENAKNTKIQDNDILRDEALNRGVTYNNILFDSDTDQKANILGAVLQMSDTDTIEWFGMNNDSMTCTKQDLLNIGGLITALHSFVWNRNAEIKEQIKEAKTIEEVENIEVNYEV